ncbi:uncharacterized protein LOC123200879 [Mangifera indica]|uniref:uncharacterized protein LOC123200879 n=1 Tax=Mangifera indica TaxID=29780 RepID=UPI001CFB0840|nr:uncharacterized protein LOC123200879 [Mangifera indica]
MKTEERSLEKFLNNPIKNVILDYDGFLYWPEKFGSTNGTAVSGDYFTGYKSFKFPLRPDITHQNFTDLDAYREPFSNPSVTESGQSSNSKNDDDRPFICEICFEPRAANDSFIIEGCFHSYCKNCIAKYVASKLEENITSKSPAQYPNAADCWSLSTVEVFFLKMILIGGEICRVRL